MHRLARCLVAGVGKCWETGAAVEEDLGLFSPLADLRRLGRRRERLWHLLGLAPSWKVGKVASPTGVESGCWPEGTGDWRGRVGDSLLAGGCSEAGVPRSGQCSTSERRRHIGKLGGAFTMSLVARCSSCGLRVLGAGCGAFRLVAGELPSLLGLSLSSVGLGCPDQTPSRFPRYGSEKNSKMQPRWF